MHAIPNHFNEMVDVSIILMLNQFYILTVALGGYAHISTCDHRIVIDVSLCTHNLKG